MNLSLQFDLAALVEFCISWVLLCGEMDNQKGNRTCLQIKHFVECLLAIEQQCNVRERVQGHMSTVSRALNASSYKSTMANVQQCGRVKTNQIVSSSALLCFICREVFIIPAL